MQSKPHVKIDVELIEELRDSFASWDAKFTDLFLTRDPMDISDLAMYSFFRTNVMAVLAELHEEDEELFDIDD